MAATRSSLPKSPFFKLVAAGEGIWAAVATDFTAAVGNSAIVDLGGRWLVVDTFMSARAATDLHEAVRSLAGDEPLWVVNTHSHMDHVGGKRGLRRCGHDRGHRRHARASSRDGGGTPAADRGRRGGCGRRDGR